MIHRQTSANGIRSSLSVGLLSTVVMLLGGVQCSQQSGESVSSSVPKRDTATPSAGILRPTAPALAAPVPAAFPGNETFIRVAGHAMASVVNISTTRTMESSRQGESSPFFDSPFFRRFFGKEFERRFRAPRPRQKQGLGSGVIVRADGYILTNHHVVEQADELHVLINGKEKYSATLIGTDPKTDLAVIKVEAENLPTLPWGPSGSLQVGEVVLAVGNPFGLNQTVTMGIISAVGRANMGIVDYEDFIQTDAAINPGNSGGALVNLRGELIGINTAIFSRTGGYMGIGFAIPSQMAENVMQSLINRGKVVRGWLGVSIQELTPDLAEQFGVTDPSGALVGNVVKDSPADRGGLERADIIQTYNGRIVRDPSHLRSLVAETAPGTTIAVGLLRNERQQELSVKIGAMPKEVTAQAGRDAGERPDGHALSGLEVGKVPRGVLQDNPGVRIVRIDPESPGAQAGLQTGDIILEINRAVVLGLDHFYDLVGTLRPQIPVLVLVKRGSGTLYLSIHP